MLVAMVWIAILALLFAFVGTRKARTLTTRPADTWHVRHARSSDQSSGSFVRDPSTYGTRGAVDESHLHGSLIGRDEDGAQHLRLVPYVDVRSETKEQKAKAHFQTCFNRFRSDSLPLDRPLEDARSAACPNDFGPLPTASIVIVFFDEPLSTLLRSVASVLHRSRPEHVHEIVLVEDGGTGLYNSTGEALKEQLGCFGEKIVLVTMPAQSGLIVARSEGARAATGDVLVFLDSHVECAPGWLEPLLDYSRRTPLGFGIPMIDSIHADSFVYSGAGLSILGFSWSLGQVPIGGRSLSPDATPTPTPIMAGGLFAVKRSTFWDFGGYDEDMRIYGGEEMEISMRAWMSGGRLDVVPCSRRRRRASLRPTSSCHS